VLAVEGVSKSFAVRGGSVQILDDISFSVPRGRFASVIGPTGCGKSTLLRIVAGLLEPDSGHVSIFGESPGVATSAKHIGLVPQAPALLPWRTVVQNVDLPSEVNRAPDPTRRRAPKDSKTILQSFGLGQVLHLKPHQLSVGMQQKVAIARAFVFDPAVLVMDEPFSALDELSRERQRHELLDVWQSDRKTVLFVTHSVPEAIVLSDMVVVMSGHPGRVGSVVAVDLPRPRRESVEVTEAFVEVEREVRSALASASGHRDG
jgi:NitT/TauT family transport system ATP-binding protein